MKTVQQRKAIKAKKRAKKNVATKKVNFKSISNNIDLTSDLSIQSFDKLNNNQSELKFIPEFLSESEVDYILNNVTRVPAYEGYYETIITKIIGFEYLALEIYDWELRTDRKREIEAILLNCDVNDIYFDLAA